MDLLKWFRRRSPRRGVDPNAPHRFMPIDDLAMIATTDVMGGLHDTGQAAVLATASDASGKWGCRVRGCGRPAEDPIHL